MKVMVAREGGFGGRGLIDGVCVFVLKQAW